MLWKSQIITEASGSIGGLTAFRSKAGLAFRSRVVPVNPSTSLQLVVRNAMASVASNWRALTQLQRDGWDAYATATPLPSKVGGTINIGGEAMYCRCNVPRLQAGLTQIDIPPIQSGTGDIAGLAFGPPVNGTPGTLPLQFTDGAASTWTDANNAALLLYVSTGPISPGKGYFDGPYRFLTALEGSSGTPITSPQNINLPFDVTAGQKVAGYARVTRADGRLTQDFRFLQLVV